MGSPLLPVAEEVLHNALGIGPQSWEVEQMVLHCQPVPARSETTVRCVPVASAMYHALGRCQGPP